MNPSSKQQLIQDQEYSFPYHYIPQNSNGFSQNLYWSWGINYLSTIEFLTTEIKKNKINSIIDIGTGDGRLVKDLVQAFPNKKILGIDYSSRAISLAKALNQKLDFLCIDIHKQNLNQKFDSATLIEVLEHISKNQIQGFIKAVSVLLSTKGLLFITVPHKNMPLQIKHVQHFNLEILRKYLEPYFIVKQVKYFGKQSYQYQLILFLLANSLFILNHKGLKNLIFSYYKKHLFFSNEESCSRIYLKLIKK